MSFSRLGRGRERLAWINMLVDHPADLHLGPAHKSRHRCDHRRAADEQSPMAAHRVTSGAAEYASIIYAGRVCCLLRARHRKSLPASSVGRRSRPARPAKWRRETAAGPAFLLFGLADLTGPPSLESFSRALPQPAAGPCKNRPACFMAPAWLNDGFSRGAASRKSASSHAAGRPQWLAWGHMPMTTDPHSSPPALVSCLTHAR